MIKINTLPVTMLNLRRFEFGTYYFIMNMFFSYSINIPISFSLEWLRIYAVYVIIYPTFFKVQLNLARLIAIRTIPFLTSTRILELLYNLKVVKKC